VHMYANCFSSALCTLVPFETSVLKPKMEFSLYAGTVSVM
jgi:hypothetical protein